MGLSLGAGLGIAVLLACGLGCAVVMRAAYRRNVHHWGWPLLRHSVTRLVRHEGSRHVGNIHLILAICDHFEPNAENPTPEAAAARVERWVRDYPRVLGGFRDADGKPPRHTFFYPVEDYDPAHLDALAGLCRAGFGEVEVHLHHDGDTADSLRDTLSDAVEKLSERHGLLARRGDTGDAAYGFIHGNWALNNARSDGRWCGVNDEIRVLKETGCYADFTYPSAPSPTQPPWLNGMAYATSDPCRARDHDHAAPIGASQAPPPGSLLMIQGPLALRWGRRKWGILPRLENGCVQASQPPTGDRIGLWLKAAAKVPSRPDWYFVKLHAHGATEYDASTLLGAPMVEFHENLARRSTDDPRFQVHYVTAREMYNLARAAEAGWRGPVDGARDFELTWDAAKPAVVASTNGGQSRE